MVSGVGANTRPPRVRHRRALVLTALQRSNPCNELPLGLTFPRRVPWTISVCGSGWSPIFSPGSLACRNALEQLPRTLVCAPLCKTFTDMGTRCPRTSQTISTMCENIGMKQREKKYKTQARASRGQQHSTSSLSAVALRLRAPLLPPSTTQPCSPKLSFLLLHSQSLSTPSPPRRPFAARAAVPAARR